MEFIHHHDQTWHRLDGEDGPQPTRPPRSHALLTLEQWHAVRDHWPAAAHRRDAAQHRRRGHAGRRPAPPGAGGAAVSQVDRRPRLLTGPAAARPPPLPATCAPPATCWSTCCRCCSAPAFPACSCAPTRSEDSARRALRFFSGHYQGDTGQVQPLFNRRPPDREHVRHPHCHHPARPQDPGSRERVAHALALLREAADATAAASCRPPAWASKAWSSPT
jgi:hypothetical protein